jgi:hypothetical protein
MRRAGAVLAALVGAVVLLAGTEPVAAQLVGAPRLQLVDQTTTVAPDGDFTVFAIAEGAADATDFAVDIYDRVPEGEAIGPVPDRDPEATFGPAPVNPPDASGDRSLGFTIQLYRDGEPNPDPQWGHQIDEPGVYPVRIRLRDGDGSIAVLMTTLLRLPEPDQQVTPASAAVLVDVHRPPPTDPEVRRTGGEADASLLRTLPPVLAALDERPELPATFSATPDTIERMAADPEAAEVLGALRTTLDGSQRTVLDASYVDLDLASMVANGLADELEAQTDAGTRTLRELLEPPPTRTWRLRDRLDGAALDALDRMDVVGLIVPGDALATAATPASPVGLAAGSGPLIAAPTSDALTVGLAAPDDPVLDAHRILARLAAEPAGRAVVAVDPDTSPDDALPVLFDALAVGSPFFTATTVDRLLDVVEAPDAPLSPVVPRDLERYPQALATARSALSSYTSMVPEEPVRTEPFEQTLLISAARDLSPEEATDDARAVTQALAVPFDAISTPPRDTVTLAARDATFPITVESDLDYPVRVIIELQSSDRVQFPNDRFEQTLQPGRQVIDVRVRTRTTGDTPVLIRVRTPDDGVLLSESRYSIRSTAVSGVGVLLTVGAAAFLALWWGRHWHRNRGTARHARPRRRRRSNDGDGDGAEV